MKLGLLVIAALLLAGCGGNATGSTEGGSSSGDSSLSLDAVAAAACGYVGYHVQRKSDLDWFASSGATCGRTQVSLFDSPGARDNWVSVAQTNGRVVVGSNWAVTPANDAVARRVQDKLGGKVLGGF